MDLWYIGCFTSYPQKLNGSENYQLAYLCSPTEKQQARGKLVRQDTSMKFDNARDAMRRFESRVESHGINAVGEEDEEEEEDDDGEYSKSPS